MESIFPKPSFAGEINTDMGDEEKPKHGILDWAKLAAQVIAIATICGLLISISNNISGYRYEVAGLSREVASYSQTLEKILKIYQRNEDAGRTAIQSQIEQLEMQRTPYTPAQRRRKIDEQITALRDKLKISKDNGGEFAGSDRSNE